MPTEAGTLAGVMRRIRARSGGRAAKAMLMSARASAGGRGISGRGAKGISGPDGDTRDAARWGG